jgi:hypothetical protein
MRAHAPGANATPQRLGLGPTAAAAAPLPPPPCPPPPPGSTFATLTNVNFDDARFMEMLHQADAFKDRLASKLAAKGAPGPKAHSPAELGWGPIGLPHPTEWRTPQGASARHLEKLSRQVGRGWGWGLGVCVEGRVRGPGAPRGGRDTGGGRGCMQAPAIASCRRSPNTPEPPPAQVGVDMRQRTLGKTLAGLQECLAYGEPGGGPIPPRRHASGAPCFVQLPPRARFAAAPMFNPPTHP